MQRQRIIVVAAAVAVLVSANVAAGHPGGGGAGFKTAQPAMLAAVTAGVQVSPLLTVGDVLNSGYRFESIPDGISVVGSPGTELEFAL